MEPWRLDCAGVSRFFGDRLVLHDVAFSTGAGHLIALYGANGAGKSTLLRILAGGLRPSRGSVAIGGEPATAAGARRQTGLLSHQSLLHPALTVAENLRFYATLYALEAPGAAVGAALERVRGEALAPRRAGELSQGMRQTAALARCLLHSPRLLLLDEPFASLDHAAVDEMRRCFAALRQQGLTLLVSSHNPAQVDDLSDGSLRMERGRLAELQGAVAAGGGAH